MSPDVLLAIIGTTVGVAGLAFGLYKYSVAQKWKQAEFAAKELSRLHTDASLALCCTMLDWSARRIPVPEEYAALAPDTTFVHSWETLATAMKPEAEKGEFPWPQIIYRDAFDRMFSYLESLEDFLRIDLIEERHVGSIEYWLKEIAHPRFAAKDDAEVLVSFIRAYSYDGVLRLMGRFSIRV